MAAARKSKLAEVASPRYVSLDAKGKQLPLGSTGVAVVDPRLGLTWSHTLECGAVSWKDAIAAAGKVRTCGFKDWRLPTRVELLTLVDDTRHDPAIDVGFFPDTKSRWYWTSTPTAFSPAGYAWVVDFDDGVADWALQSGGGFVRAVRASQSSDIGNRA